MLCLLLLLAANADAAEPVLAVLDFAAHTDDAERAALGRGTSDMLMTDLQRGEDVRVVERQRLDAILEELALQASDFVDDADAVQVGQGLGATQVVVGALTFSGDTLRIDARLVDVETAQSLEAVQVEGNADDFFALERRLARKLLVKLDVPLDGHDLTYFDSGVDDTPVDIAIATDDSAFGQPLSLSEPYVREPIDPAVKKGGIIAAVGAGVIVGTWGMRRGMNHTTPGVYAGMVGTNTAGWVLLGVGSGMAIKGSF